MTRRKRRNHSSAFKATVALEELKDEQTLGELAEQFDGHPNQIQEWEKRLMEEAEEVCEGAGSTAAQHTERERKKPHTKVGQLTMENDCLAKVLAPLEQTPRTDPLRSSVSKEPSVRPAVGVFSLFLIV